MAAIAGLYLFIAMQIMFTQPLQGALRRIDPYETKYKLGPKLTQLLRDVKGQNKAIVRLRITALGIDESDFEEHLGDLGRDPRRTHAVWFVKGVGKTAQGQPLHLAMVAKDGIVMPNSEYASDEELKLHIKRLTLFHGYSGKRVGFVQDLGKQRAWTASVNKTSIDLIYLGKTEAVVKHVFGKADKMLGEWRAYTGMNITDAKGEKYQTVWFWIAKGVVKKVGYVKGVVKEIWPKVYQAPDGSTLTLFEDDDITLQSPDEVARTDKSIKRYGFIMAFNCFWRILPNGNWQFMGRSDGSKVSDFPANSRSEKLQIIWRLKR